MLNKENILLILFIPISLIVIIVIYFIVEGLLVKTGLITLHILYILILALLLIVSFFLFNKIGLFEKIIELRNTIFFACFVSYIISIISAFIALNYHYRVMTILEGTFITVTLTGIYFGTILLCIGVAIHIIFKL